MDRIEQKLARLYAQAYMQVYGATLTRAQIHTLDQMSTVLFRDERVYAIIDLPHAHEMQQEWFTQLAKQSGVESWLAVVLLLIKHGRLALISLVTQEIVVLAYQKHELMQCTIETACPLPAHAYETIAYFFKTLVGKEIIYTTKIDTALIAGVRISSSTVVWEDSIRKRLNDCAKVVRKGYA